MSTKKDKLCLSGNSMLNDEDILDREMLKSPMRQLHYSIGSFHNEMLTGLSSPKIVHESKSKTISESPFENYLLNIDYK